MNEHALFGTRAPQILWWHIDVDDTNMLDAIAVDLSKKWKHNTKCEIVFWQRFLLNGMIGMVWHLFIKSNLPILKMIQFQSRSE
mmetsp:Transcript_3919/g.8539  ORF Transcript_3919/g.8539 Transcript_3919/m.8539 type:complete len:84 (+) Transcript_3919:1786-2037(+)